MCLIKTEKLHRLQTFFGNFLIRPIQYHRTLPFFENLKLLFELLAIYLIKLILMPLEK